MLATGTAGGGDRAARRGHRPLLSFKEPVADVNEMMQKASRVMWEDAVPYGSGHPAAKT
jgi:hypothetical protein